MAGELPRIWIITNPEHPDGPVRPVVEALRACRGGVVGIQLRAKQSSDRELVAWGRALRTATHESGSLLIVNGRVDVAQIVDADGVHLPEHGLSVAAVRREWPEIALHGVSRHGRDGLEEAVREGAAFAFLSPVFPVPGKADPMGVEGFAAAIEGVEIPTYALGGIQPQHVGPLVAAGAAGFAVRRAIYDAKDPCAALRAFLDALDKNATNGE